MVCNSRLWSAHKWSTILVGAKRRQLLMQPEIELLLRAAAARATRRTTTRALADRRPGRLSRRGSRCAPRRAHQRVASGMDGPPDMPPMLRWALARIPLGEE